MAIKKPVGNLSSLLVTSMITGCLISYYIKILSMINGCSNNSLITQGKKEGLQKTSLMEGTSFDSLDVWHEKGVDE